MKEILAIPNLDFYAVISVLALFGGLEYILGHYKDSTRRKDDWILESVGFFVVIITKLLLVAVIYFLGKTIFPAASGAFVNWSLLIGFPFYILIDDFCQYWYHRSAHEYDWLWKHHRVHHDTREMGILTSYRNSWVYYLIMPNLWWAAIATFLGLAPAVILGLIFKQLIVTSTHSTWKWDTVLYNTPLLRPFAWIAEHIFITPAFHHGHHGRSQDDHISEPNGNYGNTFSLWDQMFGTAKFTRAFPKAYGLQSGVVESWTPHLLYPFVKSDTPGSELSKQYKREKRTGTEPLQTTLKAGTYLYCQCGYSSNQPWCNGSHHGSKFRPMVVEIKKEKKASICTCKLTKTPPYCDDSHKSISS